MKKLFLFLAGVWCLMPLRLIMNLLINNQGDVMGSYSGVVSPLPRIPGDETLESTPEKK